MESQKVLPKEKHHLLKLCFKLTPERVEVA